MMMESRVGILFRFLRFQMITDREAWASEENLTDEEREGIERLRDIEDYLMDWP